MMTDRDEFAKIAMGSLITGMRPGFDYNLRPIAERAYELADEMLAVREQPPISAVKTAPVTEPFAYAIQAPIGSVTPLFHKRKDAEDYIAKLTDSREAAKIIPLYRAPLTVEIMMESARKACATNDALYIENVRLQRENAGLRDGHIDLPTCDPDTVLRMPTPKLTLTDAERDALESCIADDEVATAYTRAATLRGLSERTK